MESITVCICTRRRPTDLARVLASLAESTVPIDQIVVSDDGDDASTRCVCDGAPVPVEYVLGPQRGLGPNRRRALREARGDYVLFLDDDCILSSTFLELATRHMKTAEAVHGQGSVIISGSEIRRGHVVVAHEQSFLGFQGRPYAPGETVRTIVMNAALFPAHLFDSIEFDPQLRYGLDEVDVATRAVAAGFRIVNVPEAQNDHRPSPMGREDYDEAVEAARLYITAKRYAVVEKRRARALAFAVSAPVHLFLSRIKRHGLRRGSGTALRIFLDAVDKLAHAGTVPIDTIDLPAPVGSADCVVDVVVPTRNRPVKLERCLRALAEARGTIPFRVYAVDSSTTPELRQAVDEVCARFPFVTMHRHNRAGLAAARNECTRAGLAPLVVSVDDDVYVAPTAIDKLVARYARGTGWRIVAGSVFWSGVGSTAVRMRRIGYGVADTDERQADFYVTALILYPRDLARQCPFNEHIRSSDDRFIGALWRSKGVGLLWEPGAKAQHDDEHNTGLQTASQHDSHIYTNLFDAIIVRRRLSWALSFEFLGFAAGAKLHCRTPRSALEYSGAWFKGNIRFLRDSRRLTRLARTPLDGNPPEVEAAETRITALT